MNIKLHLKQQEVLDSVKRFMVFAAGRRAGKTFLAAVWLYIRAMEAARPGVAYGPSARVLYVAPTIGMADDLMTDLFADLAKDHIQSFNVKKLEFTMVNGRKVKLAGTDKPRSLRGGSIIGLVMDEVQDIRISEVWDRVLRPGCGDLKAPVLFIGTPLPGTSEEWHDLYKMGMSTNHPEWGAVHCTSEDNPFIDMKSEVAQARSDGVSEAVIQAEFFASFELMSASHFEVDNLPTYVEVPKDSLTYLTVDLAGFGDLEGLTLSEVEKLDETAAAVVSVCPKGDWYLRIIKHGRWGVAKTSTVLANLIEEYKPFRMGIEKGIAMNAVLPTLREELDDRQLFLNIEPLSHGNQKKFDRIFWALQGRLERRKIYVPKSTLEGGPPPPWVLRLIKQLMAMPSRYVHDDLADALSYINQIAERNLGQMAYDTWEEDDDSPNFEPLDKWSGF